MMKIYIPLLLIIIFINSGCDITDNNPANEITSIYLFDTYISRENLSALLSNKFADYEAPIRIFIGEEEFKGTIEAQGSGSRYLPKWSYEIELKEGKIFELDNFNLSAQVGDPSMLKTVLASYIYKGMGFEVFDSDFAFLKINGENKGLYYIIERIEKDFFRRRGMPVYEVIKTMFGARFTLKGGTNLYEFFEKEIPDNENLFNFENFIYALDTVQTENIFSGDFKKLLNLDTYLKYHAVSTIIAAKDGFRNNLIFHKKTPDSPYEILPWDFDGAFNPSFKETFYGDNEIINKLLLNELCYAIYNYHYSYCLENIFTESNLFPQIDSSVGRIKTAYDIDPYLGEAGYNLVDEANKLKSFISERRKLLTGAYNYLAK